MRAWQFLLTTWLIASCIVLPTLTSNARNHNYPIHMNVSGAPAPQPSMGIRMHNSWQYSNTSSPVAPYHNHVTAQIAVLNSFSAKQIIDFFAGRPPTEVLEQLNWYASSQFQAYARTLPGYDDFMINLHARLDRDHGFRKLTRDYPGFNGKSGFYNFIAEESKRIYRERAAHAAAAAERHQREQRALAERQAREAHEQRERQERAIAHAAEQERMRHVYELHQRECTQLQNIFDIMLERHHAAHAASNVDDIERYQQRLEVLQQGLHALNMMPGEDSSTTRLLARHLDHEMQHTRAQANMLLREHGVDAHVQTLVPAVFHLTDLASLQKQHEIAFNLLDASHYLLRSANVLASIMRGIATGVGNSVMRGPKMLMHPIDQVIKPLAQAGMLLGSAIIESVKAANEGTLLTKLSQATTWLVSTIYHHPEETAAFVTELLLPAGAINKLASIKEVSALATALRQQKNIATALGTLQKTKHTAELLASSWVIEPLTVLLSETGNAIKLWLRQGNQVLRHAFNFAEKDAEVITSAGLLQIPMQAEKPHDFASFSTAMQQHRYNQKCKQDYANSIMRSQLRPLIAKIQNVGNDILDIMELTGGHTLLKHVSQSAQELIRRVMKDPKAKTATSFSNKRIAIAAVKDSLKKNSEKIATWLKTCSGDKIIIDHVHKFPVGYGVPQNKKKVIENLTASRIVLFRDNSNDFGFKILTAFPIIK